ncbi:hypothetical protein [Sphingomonas adhaesiva]|uniref:hypothetical protein n=1 Tax=Sphingomonas adhaesiva TaxID=28212 RepID=UPI002FF49FC7
MIARIGVLVALDTLVLAVAALGGAALPVLLGHVVLTLAALAIWLTGGRIGVAPAVIGMLGPAALLACCLLFPGTRILPRRRDDAPDETPAPRRQRSAAVARLLDGRVRHAAPDMLGSLATVMRHGEVAARRTALETVVRSFEPALSPLVALALTDEDQTIRALAAAAAARIVHNLTESRATMERRVAAGDAGAAPRLAALLADHARANVLLSTAQRQHLREAALALHRDPRTAMEAAWAARDYDAIDRLSADQPESWWRTEAAA